MYQRSRGHLHKVIGLMMVLYVLLINYAKANEPDSVYLFAYATDKNDHHDGLHFAWSIDKKDWHAIGPEYSFLRCDYGRWGSEKKMYSPFLFHSADGLWHCVWGLNERDGAFAYASSEDLVYWGRQSYPVVMKEGNCLSPEIFYDPESQLYVVRWDSDSDGTKAPYAVTTRDFKEYSATKKSGSLSDRRETVFLSNKVETGTVHFVSWQTIDRLIKEQQLSVYKQQLYAENTQQDPERFRSLKPLQVVMNVENGRVRKISDLLMGIFFEDINYAADGGLYAQLVQNGGFEYDPGDRGGSDPTWNSTKAWSADTPGDLFTIDTVLPVHPNNKHYAVIQMSPGYALSNEGFDGIPVTAGEKYDFSVFVRSPEAKKGGLLIRLLDKDGGIIGEARTKKIAGRWEKQEAVLTAKKTVPDARLWIQPQMVGRVDLDMVSLFPQKTFKGRKNGMRPDLAQMLSDLKPRFVRFPGGCVAHGDGLENIYHWKNTIGPLEARKPQRNLWGYHQSYGLGYYEYFQFCEDIGAEPVPVLAAGVPCQNSGHHGHVLGGQQGGIPMCEMDEYVQDILDLIEYANGDVKTKWGRKRAEAGHLAPFNLKYVGIGNEDLITDVFEERFAMIFKAVKERYPEIQVIGTVGPFYEGTDYVEGWELASKLGVPVVDEHYYNPPGWFIHNQDFYDKYDRSKPKVYLGEYAAHLPGRPNNMETALAEALHLCNVERNGEVVIMTSYAPLLAKEGHTQWNPDLIYFNNTEVKPTVGYYVQQLFGQNAGDEYVFSKLSFSNTREDVRCRVVQSVVRDRHTGDWIVKLVNLLPVETSVKINWGEGGKLNDKAIRTVLCGAPGNKEVKPVSDTFDMASDSVLPPYSFTVLRVKELK